MATHSSILAWRIPGMGEPSGLPSTGSHRVGHDWSDLAAAAVARKSWRVAHKMQIRTAGNGDLGVQKHSFQGSLTESRPSVLQRKIYNRPPPRYSRGNDSRTTVGTNTLRCSSSWQSALPPFLWMQNSGCKGPTAHECPSPSLVARRGKAPPCSTQHFSINSRKRPFCL